MGLLVSKWPLCWTDVTSQQIKTTSKWSTIDQYYLWFKVGTLTCTSRRELNKVKTWEDS
ncbi:hypothetical protein [Candidatus Hodgkinia cicadicola]|uniref:hypothetical protein n=1 Tax=Candidatus Hodgkinia cicadicola TaxID=573658 RepID=UPI001788C811